MATPKYDKKTKSWNIRASYYIKGELVQKYKGGFKSQIEALEWENFTTARSCEVKADNLFSVIDNFLIEKQNIDKAAPATIEFYKKYFSIIINAFGDIDINKITVVAAQNLLNKHASTPRKCKGIKQTLSVLLNYAERLDILNKNIISKLKITQYEPKETIFYTLEQYKNLLTTLKVANHYIYIPILIIGTCGLRPSEALALTINDLTPDCISINKSCSYVKQNDGTTKIYIKEPKTKKSKRIIGINKDVYDELTKFRNDNNLTAQNLCCTNNNTMYKKETLNTALVEFLNKHKLPKITPYGLRHTFGQNLKALGTDIYTISRLMGHSNIQTTANIYLHNDNKLENAAMSNYIDNLNK